MVVLKRIGPMSLARVYTILMIIFGLLMGAFYALMGLYIQTADPVAAAELSALGFAGNMFTPWALIIMPVTYAIIGFLGALIGAGLYNVVAKRVGGIKLDLSK